MPSLRLFYSRILILIPILLSAIQFANSIADFVRDCQNMAQKLQAHMGRATMTQAYVGQPLVAAQNEFAHFELEKIKVLARELNSFNKKYKKTIDAEYFFDQNVIKKFVNAYKFIKISESGINYGQALTEIIGNYPGGSFHRALDKLLWKFEDENLEKETKENGEIYVKLPYKFPPLAEYEGGEEHSTGRQVSLPEEYVKMRKMVNEYIKEFKIEMVYGQGFAAFTQIKINCEKIADRFKEKIAEMEMEAENYVKENKRKIGTIMKEIQEKRREILENNFIEIGWKKQKNPSLTDIPKKYAQIPLYNLLNNATNELYQNLESLISEAVDGIVQRKEMPMPIWAMAELVVKPKLTEALEGAAIRYPLVELIQRKLELEETLFTLERQTMERVANVLREPSRAIRESRIRFAAAKILLAYERLKEMYIGKNDLAGEELEEAKGYAQQAMDTFLMAPMKTQTLGELIENYYLNLKAKSKNKN